MPVREGMYSTLALSEAKVTDAFTTPGTFFFKVLSIVIAQLAQVIPVTGMSTVALITPYPPSWIFSTSFSTWTRSGSKDREASSVAKFTVAAFTPGSFFTVLSMARAQLAQLIPVPGMLMFFSAMPQSRILDDLSNLSSSREVDILQGRFDLVQVSWLIPLDGDLLF